MLINFTPDLLSVTRLASDDFSKFPRRIIDLSPDFPTKAVDANGEAICHYPFMQITDFACNDETERKLVISGRMNRRGNVIPAVSTGWRGDCDTDLYVAALPFYGHIYSEHAENAEIVNVRVAKLAHGIKVDNGQSASNIMFVAFLIDDQTKPVVFTMSSRFDLSQDASSHLFKKSSFEIILDPVDMTVVATYETPTQSCLPLDVDLKKNDEVFTMMKFDIPEEKVSTAWHAPTNASRARYGVKSFK